MSDSMLKIRLLLRSELAIVQIRVRRTIHRSAHFIVAALFGLLALGMFNLAGFHYFSSTLGPAGAALVMGLINAALAAAIALLAGRAGPSDDEEQLALEMRDLAYTELSGDVQALTRELNQIKGDIMAIRAGFSSVVSGISSLVVPVLGMLGAAGRSKPKE